MPDNSIGLSTDGYSIMATEHNRALVLYVSYHNSSRNSVVLTISEDGVEVRETGKEEDN